MFLLDLVAGEHEGILGRKCSPHGSHVLTAKKFITF